MVAKTWSSALTMPGSQYRWYHSTAVLLPDGSVLSAGSNDEYNGRVYYPSYLTVRPKWLRGNAKANAPALKQTDNKETGREIV